MFSIPNIFQYTQNRCYVIGGELKAMSSESELLALQLHRHLNRLDFNLETSKQNFNNK